MLDYSHNAVNERARIAELDVVENCLLERIIHDAVELPSNKIAPADTVALLVGSVLPDLTVDDIFFAL